MNFCLQADKLKYLLFFLRNLALYSKVAIFLNNSALCSKVAIVGANFKNVMMQSAYLAKTFQT